MEVKLNIGKKILIDTIKQIVTLCEDGETFVNYHAKFGKHSIWIPERQIKIIWSWKGKICSFVDWDKGSDAEEIKSGFWNNGFFWDTASLQSVMDEIEILRLLADKGMAPPIGKLFYFEHCISNFPFGVPQCDSNGVFAYEMENAYNLPKGNFSPADFQREFVETGIIRASEGAIGDIIKPDNSINGYLIDVRRTLWDMMFLENPSYCKINLPKPNKEVLEQKIRDLTQFPHKQRKQNYQTYFMNGKWNDGSRNTLERLKIMGISDPWVLKDKSVLDIGCNLGSMCFAAKLSGAKYVTGIDYESDYVDCARELSIYNKTSINFMNFDLEESNSFIWYINKLFPMGIDILFALSVYKHIGDHLFRILQNTNWKFAFIESHNAPDGENTDHVKRMIIGMDSLNCKRTYLGTTNDRSPRLVWRLER